MTSAAPGTSAFVPSLRREQRTDVLLLVAVVLVVAVHGALLLSGSYRSTYDAYVHMFFADHYQRDWFSTWDTRWYTGFTVTSYPPGAHMLVALAGGVVGLSTGFALVQLAALVLLVVGVHRFARIWVSNRAAGWAAILAALSPVLGLVVHVFGQLPTTVGLAFTLNALPSVHRWVRDGGSRNLVTALAGSAAATAAHHVTTLFGAVFFVGPVVAVALVERLRTPLDGEPTGRPARLDRSNLVPVVARRLRRVLVPTGRAAVYGVGLITVLVVVVLPYWLWSQADPIVQIPIPHSSRSNFLEDRNAGLVFWLVPWGAILLAWPFAVAKGLRSRAWPLAASVALLTVLGLGGTTPVARLLTRGAFDILTFDRFTVWAAIAILPLVGAMVESVVAGPARAWLVGWFGRLAPAVLASVAIVALLSSFLFAATLTRYRPFQPDPIDPDPITDFLAKDDHDNWRYLTLGFGDQMAWVSAQTTATTVDGNYHSARRLPELVTRPVERLEGAKYRGVPGLGSLQQFLAVPERYHLKFVFSNDRFYDPLLHASGWQRLGALRNGVDVWERADVPPLPEVLPTKEIPGWQRLGWGLLPPLAILSAAVMLLLHAWRPAPAGAGRVPFGLRTVDRALGRQAARIRPGGRPTRWQAWRPAVERLAARLRRPVSLSRRRVQAAVALGIVAVPLVLTGRSVRAPDEPFDVLIAWYDAMDLRDHEAAHALLDPDKRPTLEDFVLGLSVDGGGLRSSYAELDGLTARDVDVDGDRASVDVTAEYVTSLTAYEVEDHHELVRREGVWRIVPVDRDPTVPLETLGRRVAVDYLAAERRQVTTGRTAFGDVLDRPELLVRSARLVVVDGRHVIVGEVANVDVDPADLTITGQLRGPDGRTWASYNAQHITLHTLRPGETTPFRIEFEGVAGATAAAQLAAGGFDPDEYVPPVLPDEAEVTTFDLYVKALVTPRNLDRPLSAAAVQVERDGETVRVSGRVRNDGVVEATVPHVIVTGLDAAGEVVWVDHQWLPDAIRPQAEAAFEVALDLADVIVLDDTGRAFGNGVAATRDLAANAVVVPVEGPGTVAAVRIDLDTFSREDT